MAGHIAANGGRATLVRAAPMRLRRPGRSELGLSPPPCDADHRNGYIDSQRGLGFVPRALSWLVDCWLVGLLCVVSAVTVMVPILVPIGDEASSVRAELREVGYVVDSVEAVTTGWFTGNDGLRRAVTEEGRVYRVSYRDGRGVRQEAYRIVGENLPGGWSFPPSVARR